METTRKDNRKYTKRTKEERIEWLKAKLATLKTFHAKQAERIARLEAKLTGQATPE